MKSKKDLIKSGDIIVTPAKNYLVVDLDGKLAFVNNGGYMTLDSYRDNLHTNMGTQSFMINRIYRPNNISSLGWIDTNNMTFSTDDFELVWDRVNDISFITPDDLVSSEDYTITIKDDRKATLYATYAYKLNSACNKFYYVFTLSRLLEGSLHVDCKRQFVVSGDDIDSGKVLIQVKQS